MKPPRWARRLVIAVVGTGVLSVAIVLGRGWQQNRAAVAQRMETLLQAQTLAAQAIGGSRGKPHRQGGGGERPGQLTAGARSSARAEGSLSASESDTTATAFVASLTPGQIRRLASGDGLPLSDFSPEQQLLLRQAVANRPSQRHRWSLPGIRVFGPVRYSGVDITYRFAAKEMPSPRMLEKVPTWITLPNTLAPRGG